MTKQSRLCVFCGLAPENKTVEHLIPKWLLSVTDTTRKGFSEYRYATGHRKLGFASITLPACANCNNLASTLEGRAKIPVEKLLMSEPISPVEIHDMLDWMDKIRVGLWLRELSVHGNPLGVIPQFRINWRVGQKDRILKVYRFIHPRKALTFIGVGTLAFAMSPSCFALAVNDLMLISCSWDFCLEGALGTPRFMVTKVAEHEGDPIEAKVLAGAREIAPLPWADRFLSTGSYLMQPICRSMDRENHQPVGIPLDSYSSAEAISAPGGAGPIFGGKSARLVERYKLNNKYVLATSAASQLSSERAFFFANAEVLRIQRYCISKVPRRKIALPGRPGRAELALEETGALLAELESASPAFLGYHLSVTG